MGKEALLILGVVALGILVAVGLMVTMGGDDDTSFASNTGVEDDDAGEDNEGVARRHTPVTDGTKDPQKTSSPIAAVTEDEDPQLPKGTEARVHGIVVDPGRKPVAGALVALCVDASDLPHHALQGRVVATRQTDDQGTFAFEAVDPVENYLLRVEHEEYASKFVPKVDVEAGEEKKYQVDLARGLRMTGIVKDKAGAVLADVEVLVTDQQNRAMDPEQNVERIVRTGPDGTFEFRNLNAGYKRVTARKEGYASQTNPTVFVSKGKEPENVLFTLGAGSFIAGRVVDPENGPIEGVIISAQPLRRGGRNIVVGNYPSVKTDKDGTFRYEGLAEGAYALNCHKKGYASRGVRKNAETGKSDVTIEMNRNPTIRGRVVDATTGDPIERFSIVMGRQEYLVFSTHRLTQRFTDENGEFEYTCDNNSGEIYLFAQAPGYAGGRSEQLTLKSGEDITDVLIPVIEGAKVLGAVTDSAGAPIAGVRVELVPQVGGQDAENPFMKLIYSGMRSPSKTAKTDAQGKFVFENVREGNYKLKGSHTAYSAADSEKSVFVPNSGSITFPNLTLMKGGTVTGIVYDSERKPEANSKVQLVEKGAMGGSGYSAMSDKSGRFTIKNVRPGIYWINVIERNGQPNANIFEQLLKRQSRPEILVEDGQTVTVDVE